jgi:hypothetical protein
MFGLMHKLPHFDEKFMEVYKEISKDSVITVRIALAIELSNVIQYQPDIKERFSDIIAQLKTSQ